VEEGIIDMKFILTACSTAFLGGAILLIGNFSESDFFIFWFISTIFLYLVIINVKVADSNNPVNHNNMEENTNYHKSKQENDHENDPNESNAQESINETKKVYSIHDHSKGFLISLIEEFGLDSFDFFLNILEENIRLSEKSIKLFLERREYLHQEKDRTSKIINSYPVLLEIYKHDSLKQKEIKKDYLSYLRTLIEMINVKEKQIADGHPVSSVEGLDQLTIAFSRQNVIEKRFQDLFDRHSDLIIF
jgi:hypothetical protein